MTVFRTLQTCPGYWQCTRRRVGLVESTPYWLGSSEDRNVGRFRDELGSVQWPVPTGELLSRGISKAVLAGPRWICINRGFYRPATEGKPTSTQRIVDASAILPPGAAIGGWAAAYVQGVDLLDGLDDRTMAPLPVVLRLPPGLHRRPAAGIRYVQPGRSVTVHQVAGLPVTPLCVTAFDLARWAPTLTEAVAAIDAILGANLLPPKELEVVRTFVGPGARQIKAAVDLSRSGVRSSWESRLRMFWVVDLGLPVPLVNPPIFDQDGTFLGIPDLLDEAAGLAMEYDGARWSSAITAGHRDVDQHRRDNHREEAFERTGLIVVRADKADLTRERAKLAMRLRAARADGLRRDRRRDRWTLRQPPGWWGLPA